MKKRLATTLAIATLLTGCSSEFDNFKPAQTAPDDTSVSVSIPQNNESSTESLEIPSDPGTSSTASEPESTTTAAPKPETTTTAAPKPETTTTAAPKPETTTTAAPKPETTTTKKPETTTTAAPKPETTTSKKNETTPPITSSPYPTDRFFASFSSYENKIDYNEINFFVKEAYFDSSNGDFVLTCYIVNPFSKNAKVYGLNALKVYDKHFTKFADASFNSAFSCIIEPVSYYVHTFRFDSSQEGVVSTYDVDINELFLEWSCSYSLS